VPVLNRIPGTRIVATPAALDAAQWPPDALVLRIAADEVYVTAPVAANAVADPHAIVAPDGGFVGDWLPAAEALEVLERTCEWELPAARPAFAQGMVAGLPVKLWLEAERIFFMTPAPYQVDFEERMT
jgi:hypothetical protein